MNEIGFKKAFLSCMDKTFVFCFNVCFQGTKRTEIKGRKKTSTDSHYRKIHNLKEVQKLLISREQD